MVLHCTDREAWILRYTGRPTKKTHGTAFPLACNNPRSAGGPGSRPPLALTWVTRITEINGRVAYPAPIFFKNL